MLKGILFDMDGVLVDNAPLHIAAFDIFCRRHNSSRQFTPDMFGRSNEDILNMIAPEAVAVHGWQALSDEKERIYREEFLEQIKPTAGLMQFLQHCREQHILCGIGSSACPENVNFIMDLFGIRDYFDAWTCSADVSHAKPDPEIYLTVSHKLGLQPHECIVMEDATAGITAGKRAGCKVVALATSNSREELLRTEADMVIDNFEGLQIEQLQTLFK